jgi:hypothetical protein
MQRKIEQGQIRSGNPNVGRDWVVTRLHTRYGKHTLGEDLVFSAAPGIEGGRGMPQGPEGTFASQAAEPTGRNNFQGRYIIRHFWDGEVECENPRRGIWGGRNGGADDASAASNVGFAAGGNSRPLATFVDQKEVPGLAEPIASYSEPAGDVVESWGKLVEPPTAPPTATAEPTDRPPESTQPETPETSSTTGTSGKGGCASGHGGGATGVFLVWLLGMGRVLRTSNRPQRSGDTT